MSVNHDIDYEALADKIASEDWEPSGKHWSLLDLAEVRAFELLRREYDPRLQRAKSQRADDADDREAQDMAVRHWVLFRDDAQARLRSAKERALEAGVPVDFIESVVSRDEIA